MGAWVLPDTLLPRDIDFLTCWEGCLRGDEDVATPINAGTPASSGLRVSG